MCSGDSYFEDFVGDFEDFAGDGDLIEDSLLFDLREDFLGEDLFVVGDLDLLDDLPIFFLSDSKFFYFFYKKSGIFGDFDLLN